MAVAITEAGFTCDRSGVGQTDRGSDGPEMWDRCWHDTEKSATGSSVFGAGGLCLSLECLMEGVERACYVVRCPHGQYQVFVI